MKSSLPDNSDYKLSSVFNADSRNAPRNSDSGQNTQSAVSPTDRLWHLVTIIGAMFLWFTAPFMAVTLFTYHNIPTAWQIITGSIFSLGDITESDGFQLAIVSIAGLITCLVFCLKYNLRAVKWTAIITELLLSFPLYAYTSAYDDLSGILGIGLWGIFLLLIILIFLPNDSQSLRPPSPRRF